MFGIERSLLHQIMKNAQKAAKPTEIATCLAVMFFPRLLQLFVFAPGSLVHAYTAANGQPVRYRTDLSNKTYARLHPKMPNSTRRAQNEIRSRRCF